MVKGLLQAFKHLSEVINGNFPVFYLIMKSLKISDITSAYKEREIFNETIHFRCDATKRVLLVVGKNECNRNDVGHCVKFNGYYWSKFLMVSFLYRMF